MTRKTGVVKTVDSGVATTPPALTEGKSAPPAGPPGPKIKTTHKILTSHHPQHRQDQLSGTPGEVAAFRFSIAPALRNEASSFKLCANPSDLLDLLESQDGEVKC